MLKVKKLAHSTALSLGSQLWILPGSQHSRWTKKIDWYLNFQISRTNDKQPRLLLPKILKILKDNPDLDFKDFSLSSGPKPPLLISSSVLLPNKQTVEVYFNKNKNEWILSIHKIWKSLKKPSLRIFLPDEIDENLLIKIWPEDPSTNEKDDNFFSDNDLDISIVTN